MRFEGFAAESKRRDRTKSVRITPSSLAHASHISIALEIELKTASEHLRRLTLAGLILKRHDNRFAPDPAAIGRRVLPVSGFPFQVSGFSSSAIPPPRPQSTLLRWTNWATYFRDDIYILHHRSAGQFSGHRSGFPGPSGHDYPKRRGCGLPDFPRAHGGDH